MSRTVYLSGFGHHSASGTSMEKAAASIATGQVRCAARRVANQTWPYYAMDVPAADWQSRTERVIRAVADELRSGLVVTDADWEQAGFFLGSSSYQIGQMEQAIRDGDTTCPPIADFAERIADWLGIHTQPWCFATACTSSLSALDAAATLIRAGVLRHALVLGVEMDNDTSVAGFAGLNLLSPNSCRPLDRDRDGLVLGEAVAAVWLSAVPCGGTWGDWRLAGLDAVLDSHSPTGPNPDGSVIAGAMSKALQRAGLTATDIDLVKLQAAGSPAVDLAEAAAVRLVFGDAVPPLLSLKPYVGHTLGASGTAELSVLVACLSRGMIPATPGFSVPDDEIGFSPATTAQSRQARHVLFNLIGFGGSVVSLVLERSQ